MTAWKKLVSTSSLFQREAHDFLCSRVRRDDGLREMQPVDELDVLG